MNDYLDVPPQTLALVHHALHAASGVRQRSDLFLWSQGPVQSCLPHGLMACALFDEQGHNIHLDCFHSTVIDAQTLAETMDAQNGLAAELARLCQAGDGSPLFLDPTAPKPSGKSLALPLESLRQRCGRLELGPALVVSTGAIKGSLSSCFVFFKLGVAPQALQVDLGHIFLPHFHLALCRSWLSKTEAAAPKTKDAWSLTARQLEILDWVQQGKTNFEIAAILGVSPLTVKNHLQKLFRRLDVHNRTQAVAKMMADAGGFRKATQR